MRDSVCVGGLVGWFVGSLVRWFVGSLVRSLFGWMVGLSVVIRLFFKEKVRSRTSNTAIHNLIQKLLRGAANILNLVSLPRSLCE